MKYLVSIACILFAFNLTAPTIQAQENSDPFRSSDYSANPFGGSTLAQEVKSPIRKTVVDIPTMKSCLELIPLALRIGADQGTRAGLANKSWQKMAKQAGRDPVATENEISKLDELINKKRSQFNRKMESMDFSDVGRAEFDETIKQLQLSQVDKAQNVEALKLKIELLERENEKLRRKLKESQVQE